MRRITLGAVALAIVLELALPRGVTATISYMFTTIADTTTVFSEFSTADPDINTSGVVAFRAKLKAGGEGMFVGSGGAITTITDTSSGFIFLDGTAPSINHAGAVAFMARKDGSPGVFVASGGSITRLYGSEALCGLATLTGGPVAINSSGTVAFLGGVVQTAGGTSTCVPAVITGNGGPLTVVADAGSASRFKGFASTVAINEAGTVAFVAFLSPIPTNAPGGDGVFTSTGGLITTIADTSTSLPGVSGARSFTSVSINAGSAVVFGTAGGGQGGSLFSFTAGQINAISVAAGPVSVQVTAGAGRHSINTGGTVSFLQSTGAFGSTCITTTSADRGPDAGGVVSFEGAICGPGAGPGGPGSGAGDPLGGSTVGTLGVPALSDPGAFAFPAVLANGTSGIFRADPGPDVPKLPLLVAAVLPSGRSVRVGSPASAFATVINAGTADGTACRIAPLTSMPATFDFQTTDPATNHVTGTANAAVDIAAGRSQSFVFVLTPTAAIDPTEVQLAFTCTNAGAAAIFPGLDTLSLSASATGVPDIIVENGTLTRDGIVHIPGAGGTEVFALAAVNIGTSGTITVSADTGAGNLPVTFAICQTDSTTGACLSPTSSTVTLQIDPNATPTFSVFVAATGIVPFFPETNRVFVRFKDASGVVRGSTSVAVQTQ